MRVGVCGRREHAGPPPRPGHPLPPGLELLTIYWRSCTITEEKAPRPLLGPSRG